MANQIQKRKTIVTPPSKAMGYVSEPEQSRTIGLVICLKKEGRTNVEIIIEDRRTMKVELETKRIFVEEKAEASTMRSEPTEKDLQLALKYLDNRLQKVIGKEGMKQETEMLIGAIYLVKDKLVEIRIKKAKTRAFQSDPEIKFIILPLGTQDDPIIGMKIDFKWEDGRKIVIYPTEIVASVNGRCAQTEEIASALAILRAVDQDQLSPMEKIGIQRSVKFLQTRIADVGRSKTEPIDELPKGLEVEVQKLIDQLAKVFDHRNAMKELMRYELTIQQAIDILQIIAGKQFMKESCRELGLKCLELLRNKRDSPEVRQKINELRRDDIEPINVELAKWIERYIDIQVY